MTAGEPSDFFVEACAYEIEGTSFAISIMVEEAVGVDCVCAGQCFDDSIELQIGDGGFPGKEERLGIVGFGEERWGILDQAEGGFHDFGRAFWFP